MSSKYFPTKGILVYHFTKLIQGEIFLNSRVEIQGIPLNTSNIYMVWDRLRRTAITRGFTEIGYVPKSRVIFKKNR